jgi:hypothetical protein
LETTVNVSISTALATGLITAGVLLANFQEDPQLRANGVKGFWLNKMLPVWPD